MINCILIHSTQTAGFVLQDASFYDDAFQEFRSGKPIDEIATIGRDLTGRRLLLTELNCKTVLRKATLESAKEAIRSHAMYAQRGHPEVWIYGKGYGPPEKIEMNSA
jgi:hypothetical protein